MKTQPWQLAEQIAAEYRTLEELLKEQVRLEAQIGRERLRINKTIKQALEAFEKESSEQSATK